jgi:hypothetical protein
MLRPIVVGLVLCLVGEYAIAQGPPVWAEVHGNTVFVKTNTPGSPKYRCNYALSVQFTDGTNTTLRGQTDPPTGGNPITASTQNFPKPVRQASVNWNCTVIE